jgi:malonyl-CoA/methylmalonyl-CoA synthetase
MSDGLFPALEATAAPDRLAIWFPSRSLSYAALRDAAAQVARSLAGVSRVAVLAESRLETCVAVIGALQAGVPIIPINPKSGARELAHIVADAGPDALLVAPSSSVVEAL